MRKTFRNSTALLRRVITSLYFLFFINGFLLAIMVYCYAEDQYEGQLFTSLKDYVYHQASGSTASNTGLILQSLHLAHNLEADRQHFFSDEDISGIKGEYLQPVSYDLMTARGACGSYSYVLGRLLMSMDYKVRFIQMKVDSKYGVHNIIEVKTGQGWVVLDPLYDLYFTRPDGALASFSDVQHNWAYYKAQLPANYDMQYHYENARYTNWSKVPVIMPAIKKVLDWTMGKQQADEICLRSIILRKFHFMLVCLCVVYFFVLIYTIRKFFRVRRKLAVLSKPFFIHRSMQHGIPNMA